MIEQDHIFGSDCQLVRIILLAFISVNDELSKIMSAKCIVCCVNC